MSFFPLVGCLLCVGLVLAWPHPTFSPGPPALAFGPVVHRGRCTVACPWVRACDLEELLPKKASQDGSALAPRGTLGWGRGWEYNQGSQRLCAASSDSVIIGAVSGQDQNLLHGQFSKCRDLQRWTFGYFKSRKAFRITVRVGKVVFMKIQENSYCSSVKANKALFCINLFGYRCFKWRGH